jgi:predicted DNA-binding transcriptional regulator YafY
LDQNLMRADRLLSILLLLQTQGRMTARELARRLEVSERTIHRDMEALSGAGVPVVAERGSGGGWSLLDNYRTNLTGLNLAETQALFLNTPARFLSDLGLDKASDAALVKLLAALPAVNRRDAEFMRQRIHIDVAGWHSSGEDVSCLPVLQEAIWQERKLRLFYCRSDNASVERVVDPLGLVAKGSAWYLVAAVEGEIRTYRASRIQEARITDEACFRPDDFDLAAYWSQSTADFVAQLPRYAALVRVSPDLFPRIRFVWRYARIERTDPPDDDGWVLIHVLFHFEQDACENVLSGGPHIEVLDPPELRELVIQSATALLARYVAEKSNKC